MLNILPSDRSPVAGVIDPDALSTGTYTTDWINMEDFANLMAVIQAGTLGSSATLDAKIVEAEDGSGTNSQDLTDKAITQLTEADSDSDKQAVINVRADELSAGYTHVQVSMTVGTASSDAAAIALGFDARFEPEDQASSVDEVVS